MALLSEDSIGSIPMTERFVFLLFFSSSESEVNHHHHHHLHLHHHHHHGSDVGRWPPLVAGHGQDVARAALGEVRLRLVDLGLHDDRALLAVHAALDGAGDVHLQLPLLTAEEEEEEEEELRHSPDTCRGIKHAQPLVTLCVCERGEEKI